MAAIFFHSTGTLFLNGIKISCKTTAEDFKRIFSNEEIFQIQSRHGQTCRVNPDEIWMNYLIESCAIEIGSSCTNIILNFVGTEPSHIDSVADCLLTKHLEDTLSSPGNLISKSLAQFFCDASRIDVLYDFKLGAPSLEVTFKT